MSGASVDAIVIGAGAGGGIVAAELARAGLRVSLLDRGRNFSAAADADDNELTGSQALYNQTGVQRFGPDATEFQTFRGDPGTPASKVCADDYRFSIVGWCVGGGTVSYQGLSWRFHPQTFRLKSLYGPIAGSTVEDWPITYDDLEPYYEKAEYELGICGEASPVGPPRRKPYPMPPLDDDREAQLLFPAARRLGWKPFHPPLAVTSEEYRGRPGCIRCSYCNGFLCCVDSKSSTAVTVIPQALKTGLCALHPQTVVREITVDGRGRPNGVIYRESNGPWKEMQAKVIVVCASAVETPRLLLSSQSKWFPTGIGNQYDQVGRHGHQDLSAAVFGYFDKVVGDGQGPGPGCAVDFQFQDSSVQGGGVLYNGFSRTPMRVINSLPRPQGMKTWGREHKEFYRQYFWKHLRMYCGAHGVPRNGNRVDLDPDLKDAFGMRVARVTSRSHKWSAQQLEWVQGRAEQLLKEAGAQFTKRTPVALEPESPLGQHGLGTCRMGSDPRNSVVDRTGRVHGVPNVFVADGSLITNSGGCNPCLTIQALAYLVSDNIVREWKEGGLNG